MTPGHYEADAQSPPPGGCPRTPRPGLLMKYTGKGRQCRRDLGPGPQPTLDNILVAAGIDLPG